VRFLTRSPIGKKAEAKVISPSDSIGRSVFSDAWTAFSGTLTPSTDRRNKGRVCWAMAYLRICFHRAVLAVRAPDLGSSSALDAAAFDPPDYDPYSRLPVSEWRASP